MQAWLEYVVKGLVDRPDAVTVTPQEHGNSTVYEMRLHPTDVGKIIGRQGATIHALRALLQVGSAKQGKRCSLELIEESETEPEPESGPASEPRAEPEAQ